MACGRGVLALVLLGASLALAFTTTRQVPTMAKKPFFQKTPGKYQPTPKREKTNAVRGASKAIKTALRQDVFRSRKSRRTKIDDEDFELSKPVTTRQYIPVPGKYRFTQEGFGSRRKLFMENGLGKRTRDFKLPGTGAGASQFDGAYADFFAGTGEYAAKADRAKSLAAERAVKAQADIRLPPSKKFEKTPSRLDQFTARFQKLTDKVKRVDVPAVLEVDVKLPKVDVPAVKMPKVDVKLPKVDVPKVDVPKLPKVPKVEIPKVDVPEVKVPKVPKVNVKLPKVDAPKLEAPKAPKFEFKLPKFGTAQVKAPEVTVREVKLPKVRAPQVQLPKFELPAAPKPPTKKTAPPRARLARQAPKFGLPGRARKAAPPPPPPSANGVLGDKASVASAKVVDFFSPVQPAKATSVKLNGKTVKPPAVKKSDRRPARKTQTPPSAAQSQPLLNAPPDFTDYDIFSVLLDPGTPPPPAKKK